MKLKKYIWILGLSLLFLIEIIFTSCQGFNEYLKEQFPELDTTTYVYIDGTLMAPVANSTLKISDFLPTSNDTNANVRLETDNDSLLHIKASFDSIIYLTAADLGYTATILAGSPLPALSMTNSSNGINIPIPDLPGEIRFKSPTILLKFYNLLAFNYAFEINSIIMQINNQTDSSSTTISFNIQASDGTNPVLVENPIDTNNYPDISTLFSNQIDSLILITTVNIPSQTLANDLTTNQYLKIDAEIDLPIIINAKNFVMADTTDFDLDLPEQIKSVLIKALAENDIPLGGKVYMAVVDSAYTDTIALITNPDFENSQDTLNIMVGTKMVTLKPVIDLLPAETDFAGNPIKAVNSLSKIYLSQASINQISIYNGQKKLLIFAKFNTYNSDQGYFVKILSDSYLNIKLGAKIEYEASTN